MVVQNVMIYNEIAPTHVLEQVHCLQGARLAMFKIDSQ
jgi:hypothetical protein